MLLLLGVETILLLKNLFPLIRKILYTGKLLIMFQLVGIMFPLQLIVIFPGKNACFLYRFHY